MLPHEAIWFMILDRQFREKERQNPGTHFTMADVFYDSYGEYSTEDDSKLWSLLWSDVNKSPKEGAYELSQAIMYARAGGCVLKKSRKYGYMIKPDYENEMCFWTPESYEEVKNIFREHNDLMLELLKGLDR